MGDRIYSNKILEQKAKDIAFKSLFNLFPVNFCWMDSKGIVLGCNQRLIDFLKAKSFNEIIGRPTYEHCNPDAWINTQKVLNSGKTTEFEETHKNPDGTITHFLSVKSPMRSCTGEILGIVNIAIDITERVNHEKELQEAKEISEKANQEKTDFLLNMQHDLRTPFCGIVSVSEFLEHNELDPFKKSFLKDIKES
jgi:two-component system, OmpR family, aerobic respiration control sensor histidine kinase ArcB